MTTIYSNKNHHRFKLYTAKEFPDLPGIQWRIQDVIPTKGLACIYGQSGTAKSFLVADMMGAIANGEPWFNHKTTPCKILCIVLEGKEGFRQRITAWEKYHGREYPQNVSFLFDSFGLTLTSDVSDLEAAIALAKGFDMIIIDTLNRAAPNADENSSQHMGQIITAAAQLQASINGLVLLVHHAGKSQGRGPRGHSSLNAAMDATIEVTREGKNRLWRQNKAKDGEDGQVYSFELEGVELDTESEDDNSPSRSCVVIPTDSATGNVPEVRQPKGVNQRIVYDALNVLLEASADKGKAGAPVDAPCVEFEVVVNRIKDQLQHIEPKRQAERTKDAIKQFVTYGWFKLEDGWLWRI